MFAERGAHKEDETRASLRMIPGLLHIWGGEGEREQEQQDPPEDDPKDQTEEQEESEDEEELLDKTDKSKKDEKSLEDQLDEERRARIKAEKALTKKEQAIKDAEADKDAVKDRDALRKKLEARDKFLTENLLAMELNKQSKFKFIDNEDVINALTRADEVTIDLESDVPSVEGLDLALKRIAKSKPHWLQKDKEEEQEAPPSGDKVGGGKTGSQDEEDRRLGAKFRIPGYGSQQSRVM